MQRKLRKLRIRHMQPGYEPLCEALRQELPPELVTRIHTSLALARARRERFRHQVRQASTAVCVLSVAGIVLSAEAFAQAAQASGFTTYAALTFSDTSIVFGNFSSFVIGLIELLPSLEIIALLALLSVFLVSLRNAATFGVRSFARIA